MPLEWNSISQSARNQRIMISMDTRVELMLPLLSERHSLINCATEVKNFISFCMVIFLLQKKELKN